MMNIRSIFHLLQFMFLIGTIKAQNFSDSTEGIPSQDTISNFQPSLAVVIGMLSIMFSLTFILILYAKFCHRASSAAHTTTTGRHRRRQIIHDGLARSSSVASGVDKTVVESLPFFRFSSLRGSREGLECSVCLSKFEDVEILRLLPKCKHAFHIDCIDRWLEKHSTCPLCRQKVSEDDLSQLPYSDSLRFLWNQSHDDQLITRQESNLELYVQREENFSNSNNGSSRFSIIGSSFRKAKGQELPIQEDRSILLGCCSDDEIDLHRFNHRINYVVSNHHHNHDVVLKSRWSNVSSSDLMFLNSEMINDVSSARFATSLDSGSGSKTVDLNEKRSMSEIIVHPRFATEIESRNNNKDSINVKEERMRKLWLPIARKTVQWFANRETRPPPHDLPQPSNLHNLHV